MRERHILHPTEAGILYASILFIIIEGFSFMMLVFPLWSKGGSETVGVSIFFLMVYIVGVTWVKKGPIMFIVSRYIMSRYYVYWGNWHDQVTPYGEMPWSLEGICYYTGWFKYWGFTPILFHISILAILKVIWHLFLRVVGLEGYPLMNTKLGILTATVIRDCRQEDDWCHQPPEE